MKVIKYIIFNLGYGSGSDSDFLTSYGSGSTRKKVNGSYDSSSTTLDMHHKSYKRADPHNVDVLKVGLYTCRQNSS